MRLKTIALSWFRGSADSVTLETTGKSTVVYGTNGAGKSSFVDGVEYLLRKGKIEHLSHEYSGSRQQKGILNTHKPKGKPCEVRLKLADDSEAIAQASDDGTFASTGKALTEWDYRRTVLRQDELAKFIHSTKGDKYSALLPLLGLGDLENAAENLRQLGKSVDKVAAVAATRLSLTQAEQARTKTLGGAKDAKLPEILSGLCKTYGIDAAKHSTNDAQCDAVLAAIAQKIESSSKEHRQHAAILAVSELDIATQVNALRTANGRFVDATETLLEEKLAILEKAAEFAKGSVPGSRLPCPACGTSVSADDFAKHVQSEEERLRGIIATMKERATARRGLSDKVKEMKQAAAKTDAKQWWDALTKGGVAEDAKYLQSLNPESIREKCDDAMLSQIDKRLNAIVDASKEATKAAPPEAVALTRDRTTTEAMKTVLASVAKSEELRRAEELIASIQSLETAHRTLIRTKAQSVITELTTDITAMWSALHPGKEITEVGLSVPEDADKAIDIHLKFYGIQQESPRLTLSEGYRNSLGLCIFLAMAKREAAADRPVVLDDVVVSLDRDHRGMVAQLLEQSFSDRQVLVFTHDREWYTELRTLLDSKRWVMRALLPWDSPGVGIRWSHKTTTFADARAQAKPRPDSACNDARKIMDIEMGIISERLEIPLPYRRGDKNDKRVAHDFLERLIKDGKTAFKRKAAAGYAPNAEATAAWEDADKALIAWGNRGSHTFSASESEASALIDKCEKAIEAFVCTGCNKGVWAADHEKSKRCECGELRWG